MAETLPPKKMTETLDLPVIDLSSSDRMSTAKSIRRACVDYGFFYLVNHGVEEELLQKVFEESKKLFLLPLEQKMKLARKEHRGYTPFYAEKLDPSLNSRGDLKETFYIGPIEGDTTLTNLNQWPSEEALPFWRLTMESYYRKVLTAGKSLISLIALALNVEENFFEKVGALDVPMAFVRLLHYPGEVVFSNEETYGASAHSDYGMITLLATDGVRGLQICREKDRRPQVWEDVQHINGAFIVNIGDMMERWTNCLFRSTLHRVMPAGQERYSVFTASLFLSSKKESFDPLSLWSAILQVAFFLDPNYDCMVECLESCCSDDSPPRFPPISSGDYLEERIRVSYSLQ